jgi:predicted nucleotidyltransferase
MIPEETIQEVIALLVEVALPRRIILFGSYARGDAREGSDLDFLVIKDAVRNRRAETVQLLRALEPTEVAADILVASVELFETWKDVPGTVLFEVSREGKVVYEAA